MLIAIHGVMLYAHYYTWSEALCLMRYKESSIMLTHLHGVKIYAHLDGVKIYAHCYTCCNA